MTIQYYSDTQPKPPLLLRRTRDERGLVDESFLDGKWQPTRLIMDAVAGHNDWVDDISEAEARKLVPAAFK